MNWIRKLGTVAAFFFTFAVAAGSTILVSADSAAASGEHTQQAASQNSVAKQAGAIKAINGDSITLTTDAGTDVTVQVLGNAKLVRVAAGQADLTNATPIKLPDLHAGDRILVRGQSSADGKSFIAAGVIAMSRSDVEAKQQHDRDDWQKRGIGGLVTAAEPTGGTVTISTPSVGGPKSVVIQTSKTTVLRRYAPGSIKFDDAKPAPLDEIKAGDQLRARGTRSADGAQFTADEVVSGSFRNIAGTIASVDGNTNTMTVTDLISKKPFVIKITDQSQLRKLPPDVAQRIAYRIKGAAAGGSTDHAAAANTTGDSAKSRESSAAASGSVSASAQSNGGAAGSGRLGGSQADFQQIVNRMPQVTLSDFKRDDAVMVVATEDATPGQVTAITLLGGVEPILTAAPAGSQSITLSPWSLGGAPAMAGAEGNP